MTFADWKPTVIYYRRSFFQISYIGTHTRLYPGSLPGVGTSYRVNIAGVAFKPAHTFGFEVPPGANTGYPYPDICCEDDTTINRELSSKQNHAMRETLNTWLQMIKFTD